MDIAEDRLADFPALAAARAAWAEGRGDALAAFERAMAERPGNVKAKLEAARAYGVRHRIARAEALLQAAAAEAGTDARVAPVIALSYARIFREDRAMAGLEAMADLAPAHRAELAVLYERHNRLAEAEACIDAVIAAVPSAPEPRLVRARILRRAGRQGEAAAALDGLAAPNLPVRLRVEALTELGQIREPGGRLPGGGCAGCRGQCERPAPARGRAADRPRPGDHGDAVRARRRDRCRDAGALAVRGAVAGRAGPRSGALDGLPALRNHTARTMPRRPSRAGRGARARRPQPGGRARALPRRQGPDPPRDP